MNSTGKPSLGLAQRALSGHAAIGLLVGALLYIVSLSGTLVVVHDRWQRWEEPNIAETGPTLAPLAAQAAMAAAMAREQGKPRTTHLYVRMPTDDLPRAVVTTDNGAWYVDRAGRIVAREGHGWTEFVIALHETLNLPLILGLIVVGMLGVALAALCITGVVAHPRIFRDAFRLRMRQDSRIARADWHNRIGVWTLPWALAVALTGAFIGLGSVGFTVLASAYTGGDLEKVYAPIFGDEPPADARPAPLPNIARALGTLAARVPHASPTYVIVHEPGTAGQHVQIIAEHPRRLIYGETYAFDAAGEWKGPVGLSDGPWGKQFAASTYNLHFGNFAGLAVEIAYMVFGLGLCVVTSTGTSLWLQKRRRRGLGGDRLAAIWEVVIWGTPLMIVALAWLRALAGPDAPFAPAFWIALAAGSALAAFKPAWARGARLRDATLWAVIGTAACHWAIYRPTTPDIVAIDLVAIALAGAALAGTFTSLRARRRLTEIRRPR
ncbi:MAG: PepSY-associated TM helix domain-containing protein [Pseudomonadota bacterium]